MMSLSDDKQVDVIDAFNTTSKYLDNILKINNVYFDIFMVSQIYPSELQLNKSKKVCKDQESIQSSTTPVYLCLVVTCWERADLLDLVCGV